MKKIYTSFIAMAAAAMVTAGAQQLPNYGFESWKDACGSSECFGATTGMAQRPGAEPTDWNGSSVNQTVSGVTKKETLVFEADGFSGNGVKLQNIYVGVSLGFIKIGSVAPGYLTLGTPWVYAVSNTSKCDGGTYGGISFTGRPDAIAGDFQRTDATGEASHIIAYAWKGTFTSKVGEKDAPTEERTDVDRAILNRSNAALVSAGTLVASLDHSFTSTTNSGWQTIEVPFTYASSETPEKINVIISAADYWERGNMKENTTLLTDNVRLVYYSRLSSIAINGATIDGFDANKYDYVIDSEMPAESDFSFQRLGNSGASKISATYDTENAKATITVSNIGGNDIDGNDSHVYTLQFNKPQAPVEPTGEPFQYTGTINIIMGSPLTDEPLPAVITITPTANNTCHFLLPNLSLPGDVFGSEEDVPLGDIEVSGVSRIVDGNTTTYAGHVSGMKLLEGAIVADVDIDGTEVDGVAHLIINVGWIMDEETTIPIQVEFNGTGGAAAITDITIDNTNAPVEYYNLQGMRVAADNLTPGIYVRRQGTEVSKILVK